MCNVQDVCGIAFPPYTCLVTLSGSLLHSPQPQRADRLCLVGALDTGGSQWEAGNPYAQEREKYASESRRVLRAVITTQGA